MTNKIIIIPIGYKAPLWEVCLPLVVKIDAKKPKQTIVTSTLLDILEYGVGDTQEIAIEDLVISLGELSLALKENEGRLSPALRDYLKILLTYIKESE